MQESEKKPPVRADLFLWRPAGDDTCDRPSSLPSPDELLGRVSAHEHVCGVGSAPKGEGVRIRRCRCGQLYIWSSGRWQRMGLLRRFLHRRKLATLSDG